MTGSRQRHLCGFVVAAVATAASGDAAFNIWVEAPAQVQAGSVFTASVWGEVSGSILEESDGGMHILTTDVLGTGVEALFSTATFPFMNTPWDYGTPEAGALRGIAAVNFASLPTFDPRNPLRLFDVEITTSSDAHGLLELTLEPSANGTTILSWWREHGVSFVLDTDPGSSRIITPAIVNVIPAPASLGLLALAGVGAVRRRR